MSRSAIHLDPDAKIPLDADQDKGTKTGVQTDPRCLFCGQPEQLVWVHGHGQCAHCGVNAMPCCDGAECHF